MRMVGLFAGIGGFELGFRAAGFHCMLLCEIDPAAQAVLRHGFPDAEVCGDVSELKALPEADVVLAGFPCQDLSQAGRVGGIEGIHSGLVRHVFRLLERAARKPSWVVLENVPFMLQLDNGMAIQHLTRELERLGYWWAYRVIDSMAFGLPQRRRRVFLVGALTGHGDPRAVLLGEEAGQEMNSRCPPAAWGFYWSEGNRGLGLTADAVPPLKGGSRIPTPPAIWRVLEGDVVTPDVRDAERLQGFPVDWTLPAVTEAGAGARARWRLVGNAVTVPVAEWLACRLIRAERYDDSGDDGLGARRRWPTAAWGRLGEVYLSHASSWPVRRGTPRITDFLSFQPVPLSARATAGFLGRVSRSRLRVPDGLLDALASHIARIDRSVVTAIGDPR